MLRRRIFSSAMASVMALSSIAVVAQAEETTNKVVTKEQLQELVQVTYGDTWRADVLCNYGYNSQEAMLDALEAADAILENADSENDDYTVAYMMVEALANKLTIYTAEQLQALIDECQPIIDTNNIYNEELQDQIYTPDSFGNLDQWLGNAYAFVTSTSSSEITDAYEKLAKAKNDLKKNAVVSKSMFRNALKQFEEIAASEFSYEGWRRGTKGWSDVSNGKFWAYSGNETSTIAYGALYEYVLECRDTIVAAYDQIDGIKGLTKTTDVDIYAGYTMAQDAIAVFNAFAADNVTKATKAGVQSLLNKYHNQLAYDYAATSADDLLAKIEDKVTEVTLYGKDEDGDPALWTTSTVFEKGHSALWATGYGTSAAQMDDSYPKDDDGNGIPGTFKLVSANAYVKLDATIYIPLTPDGYWDYDRDILTDKTQKDDGKYQTVSKNSKFDIAKLVDVREWIDESGDLLPLDNDTADYVEASGAGETNSWGAHAIEGWTPSEDFDGFDYTVSFSEAYALAQNYLNGDYVDGAGNNYIDFIDTAGYALAEDMEPSGSTREWTLVYRYLYYALTEKYEGVVDAGESYTRADVKQLIADAWELIDETGDAAIFNKSNVALVEARKLAVEWVADANSDRTYKEYQPGESGDGALYVSSTDAYKALNEAYTQLKSEYDALAYSFGDIYDALADTAEKIDDGELDATDDLLKALEDTAYALSTVEAITYAYEAESKTWVEYEDNAAFDEVRNFLANNRLITWDDKDNPVNVAQIVEDLDLDAAADETAKIYCYVDDSTYVNGTHFALLNAYKALNAAIAAQAEPEFIPGDANGDKAVTPADAAAILKFSVGLAEIDEKAADFNEDGSVTPADAAAILKYCVQ